MANNFLLPVVDLLYMGKLMAGVLEVKVHLVCVSGLFSFFSYDSIYMYSFIGVNSSIVFSILGTLKHYEHFRCAEAFSQHFR